jgi:hypothetical protein
MTTAPAPVDAPFHVSLEVSNKGRIYYIHHCCGKRYINMQQLLQHRRSIHRDTTLEAENLCRDAYAAQGMAYSSPRRRTYVREVCTCAAGQPECPACVEYRRWFGGHPSVPEMQRANAHMGILTMPEYEARYRDATIAYRLATMAGNILEAQKQKRRIDGYRQKLKKLRLAQE